MLRPLSKFNPERHCGQFLLPCAPPSGHRAMPRRAVVPCTRCLLPPAQLPETKPQARAKAAGGSPKAIATTSARAHPACGNQTCRKQPVLPYALAPARDGGRTASGEVAEPPARCTNVPHTPLVRRGLPPDPRSTTPLRQAVAVF